MSEQDWPAQRPGAVRVSGARRSSLLILLDAARAAAAFDAAIQGVLDVATAGRRPQPSPRRATRRTKTRAAASGTPRESSSPISASRSPVTNRSNAARSPNARPRSPVLPARRGEDQPVARDDARPQHLVVPRALAQAQGLAHLGHAHADLAGDVAQGAASSSLT